MQERQMLSTATPYNEGGGVFRMQTRPVKVPAQTWAIEKVTWQTIKTFKEIPIQLWTLCYRGKCAGALGLR
jgi:hypothetical protein